MVIVLDLKIFHMKRKDLKKLLENNSYIKTYSDLDNGVAESLQKTWDNLPDDTSEEDRLIILDLMESTLKVYSGVKSEFSKKYFN